MGRRENGSSDTPGVHLTADKANALKKEYGGREGEIERKREDSECLPNREKTERHKSTRHISNARQCFSTISKSTFSTAAYLLLKLFPY